MSTPSPSCAWLLLTIITFRYSGSRYRFGLFNLWSNRSSHTKNDWNKSKNVKDKQSRRRRTRRNESSSKETSI